MSIGNDSKVLYARILHAQANTRAKYEHLARYLVRNNIVVEYLHYFHNGELPSQVFVDDHSKDYLQDSYDF